MPIYYKVVKGSLNNLANFEQEIAGLLTSGYIPVGGMTTPDSYGNVYQAIAFNTNAGPMGPGGPRPSIPTRPLGGGATPQSGPSSGPQ
jgi:hypothetical protein